MKKRINNTYTNIANSKNINFIKSGIDKFENKKIYLDTSCVSNTSINDMSYIISYKDRPSRANMQPINNSVWFAKLKDSPKYIIVKEYSNMLKDTTIFSTGFCGLEIHEKQFNLYATYFISNIFDKKKNSLCIGATMQAVNNSTIEQIDIPKFTEEDFKSFNELSEPILRMIYNLDLENIKLNNLKQNYLSKFF